MGRPDRHDEDRENEKRDEERRREDTPRVPRTPAQPPKPQENEGSTLARVLTAGAAIGILFVGFGVARADPDPTFHCDVLGDKTPFVCVHNSMKRSIGNISCSGFWGTTNMSVPNASIPAGHTTVIKFDAGKCKKQIDIETKDGHSFTIKGFDFEKNFNLDVNDQ